MTGGDTVAGLAALEAEVNRAFESGLFFPLQGDFYYPPCEQTCDKPGVCALTAAYLNRAPDGSPWLNPPVMAVKVLEWADEKFGLPRDQLHSFIDGFDETRFEDEGVDPAADAGRRAAARWKPSGLLF